MVNESARSSISKSIQQGIKPVLPVCYYEYGESLLEEEDLTNALFYYRFSGMIAGALGFTNISSETTSSRYVGIPESQGRTSILQGFNKIISIVIAICMGIAGLGMGLIIGSYYAGKKEKEEDKKWPPKNFDDYYRRERYYQRKSDMPRSIKAVSYTHLTLPTN